MAEHACVVCGEISYKNPMPNMQCFTCASESVRIWRINHPVDQKKKTRKD